MELKSTKICPVCHKQTLIYGFKRIHCTNCNAYQKRSNNTERFRVWCIGKNWLWRALFLTAASYVFWRVYNFPDSPFIGYSIPIAFHRLGNVAEVAIPTLLLLGSLMLYFYFAAVIAGIWLACNLADVSTRININNPYLVHSVSALVFMLALTGGIYTIICMIWANRKSVQA